MLSRSLMTRFAAAIVVGALSLGIAVAPASAQQSGLVNVVVSNNTVQVPVAVAADVCGLQVGILAQGLAQGPVNCTSSSGSTATATRSSTGSGGGPQQGLVNLAIVNNTIQAPVGIAANICGIQAGVLATLLAQGPTTCNATGNGTATG